MLEDIWDGTNKSMSVQGFKKNIVPIKKKNTFLVCPAQLFNDNEGGGGRGTYAIATPHPISL